MKRIYNLRQLLLMLLLLISTVAVQAAKREKTKPAKGGAKESALSVEDAAAQLYADRVMNSFMGYYEKGLDEKLYLQTDKQYYSSGEQIWFKGYLVSAITHTTLDLSNFIYVELINSYDELISRVKVRRVDGMFNGYIMMDPTIEPGNYTIKAYTKWMTNKTEDFFFSKNIQIVSAISDVKSSIDPNDKAAVKAAERAAERAAAKAEQETEKDAKKSLKYDVQFFPEGGALLAGISQIVAFKALAEDGLSLEVTGKVYNSKDEYVTDISSVHKGMGMFQFIAQAGESYTAKMESSDGLQMSFKLPTVETTGVAINVSKIGDRNFYQILTTDPNLLQGCHVVVHSRGEVITVSEATTKPASVPSSLINSGITTFSIVDSSQQVISERLIFKKPETLPNLKFQCSAENFAKRDMVSYKISVTDQAGKPMKGEFAVSVTDDSSIISDPAKGNILSYMLLSADIKGHVEDPGLYFEENSATVDYRLDLLMRTQAWRRFDLGEVLTASAPSPKVFYEDVASITGSVKGFFGNMARRPNVAVFCSKVNYVDIFELDESSRFKLVGLNIPDSATYIVRAQGRNGGNSMVININEDPLPTLRSGIAARQFRQSDVPTAFVNQSKDKFFYEGGMQTIELESISVTTNSRQESSAGLFVTRSTGRDMLEMMSGRMFSDLIATYLNMNVDTTAMELYYRDESDPIRFIVDGADQQYMDVCNMLLDYFEQVDFYTGAEATAFGDAAGGVFVITLRDPKDLPTAENPNIAFVSQLGYQKEMKFFQPRYELASIKRTWPPDYRSTIYWDGTLKTDDYGNVYFSFYAADKPTTYTVTVEGVTSTGEFCVGTASVERTLAD